MRWQGGREGAGNEQGRVERGLPCLSQDASRLQCPRGCRALQRKLCNFLSSQQGRSLDQIPIHAQPWCLSEDPRHLLTVGMVAGL